MTLQQAERILDGFLEPIMQTLGFRRTACLMYARQIGDAIARLSWPCRVDPRGFVAFTAIAGLRFEKLADWLDHDTKTPKATVASPLHLLRDDKRFVEWKFTGRDDLEPSLKDAILSDLRNFAMPYIEQYSRLSEVRKAVESPDPKDWRHLRLDVDSRIEVLASIQMIEGEKSKAIETLDDALSERKTGLPKRRIYIERLKKRLLESVLFDNDARA